MAGGHTTNEDTREQLVLKGYHDEGLSCSTTHMFPQYELPLPGTMPSTSGIGTPEVCEPVLHGDHATRNEASGSSKGATLLGSTPPGANGVVPGSAVAPQLMTSPRLPMPSASGSSAMAAMEIQEALLPPQQAVPFEHPISLPRRRWMVFMFCLVAALLFADQNLLAPNLTAAAHYFNLSERQKDTLLGGALMAAFFAVGAPAALLVGWLADRGDINRRTLLFWVVVVGETPCLLTYWVKSYWQFFLLRALTGVAVGGCFPLVFSLLGDLYPPGRRAGVSAVVQIATGVGLAAGQALSGSIGPATSWRVPFVVVAGPSLAVALLMQLTTIEPPRGAFEEALRERYAEGLGAYEGSISWSKVAVLLRCPSNVLIISQGLPGSLPWGMVLTYFNDFLAQQKGFTVQAATGVLLFFAGGGALGVIGGGAGGQWLYNKRKEYQALLAGCSVLAGIGPLYALINADLLRIGLGPTCVLAAIGGAVASVAGPNLRSVMLNVNEPETRGVALALQSMTDDLGKGLGPVVVAGLIRALGREGAFNVATAGWIPCSFILASLACFMRKDEAAMQARLALSSDTQAAAVAQATAAAAGDDLAGSGITVVLPPTTPPSQSDGGAGDGSAAGGGGTVQQGTTAATAAALRKEEWRLAKVRLLEAADGVAYGRSDAAVAAGDSSSICDYTTTLPLSSSAVDCLGGSAEDTRWAGRGGFGAGMDVDRSFGAAGSLGNRTPATAATVTVVAAVAAATAAGSMGLQAVPPAADSSSKESAYATTIATMATVEDSELTAPGPTWLPAPPPALHDVSSHPYPYEYRPPLQPLSPHPASTQAVGPGAGSSVVGVPGRSLVASGAVPLETSAELMRTEGPSDMSGSHGTQTRALRGSNAVMTFQTGGTQLPFQRIGAVVEESGPEVWAPQGTREAAQRLANGAEGTTLRMGSRDEVRASHDVSDTSVTAGEGAAASTAGIVLQEVPTGEHVGEKAVRGSAVPTRIGS